MDTRLQKEPSFQMLQRAQSTVRPRRVGNSTSSSTLLTLSVTHSTPLVVEKTNACVVIQTAECLGYRQDQQVDRLAEADVILRMTSSQGLALTTHINAAPLPREN